MPTENKNPFIIMTNEVMAESNVKFRDNVLFRTATDFSQFVELESIRQNRSCIDILIEYCDEKNIEPDTIAKLVNESLKGKVEQEMIEAGLLNSRNTLDSF